jgi:WD40 repeat protein
MAGSGISVIEVAIGQGRTPGTFRVEVLRSAAGEASTEVALEADRLAMSRPLIQQALLASAVSTRRILTEAEHLVRDAGQALFTALLGTGEVAGRYRASSALADRDGEGLRVVLRIDSAELAGLPWEAMYDPAAGAYVCRRDPLVRHVPVASVPLPLTTRPPLRILGVASSPRGLPALDVDKERDQLTGALAGLVRQRLAEIVWAPSATWAGLHDMLMAGQWQVVHFIGHGDFDAAQDEGVLALTREDGRADLVEASRFTDLLRQARPMPRLVVLNSCSGAATSSSDLFSGTAAALARSGVSAVAAMQYEISDPAAVAFARGFYAAIAHGRGVDEAASSGRVAILGTGRQTLEWITPVLYLRGHDARLFIIPPGNVTAGTPTAADAPPARAAPQVRPSAMPTRRPARLLRTLAGHNDAVIGIAFSPDGALLATTSRDRTARLWDTSTGALTHTLSGHDSFVFNAAFSPDGALVATTSDDRTARVWDTATGAVIHALTGHTNSVYRLLFSPDGALIATTSSDNTARLWDAATGNVIHVLTGHSNDVYGVAISPDGTLIATASFDQTARLWDMVTGNVIHALTGHTSYVHQVVFSPDGAVIATTSSDKTARLWDTATGAVIRVLTGHSDGVYGVAFSPDGDLLATTSRDKTARLWRAATGTPRHALVGHTDYVHTAAFSPDGGLLATASVDNTARLWDTATGRLVRTLTGHTSDVFGVAFSPDGTLLASYGEDGTARLWG